jgi:hypothetical protein
MTVLSLGLCKYVEYSAGHSLSKKILFCVYILYQQIKLQQWCEDYDQLFTEAPMPLSGSVYCTIGWI